MKVYYAHCMAIYNTQQEVRDVALLSSMGFDVLNPNCPELSQTVRQMRADGKSSTNIMDFFMKIVASEDIDALVFRALPDGSLPAGVAKEIKVAEECGKPILELPSGNTRRTLSVQETREYLREIGQR
jgi:hypothetical protein